MTVLVILFAWGDGTELPGPDYDEWDCLEDAEAEGLIENVGTGINPIYRMTDRGNEVAGLLRSHKSNGGSFSNFKYDLAYAAS